MRNKIFYLYILFGLFFSASVFADESSSSASYQNDLNKLVANSSDNIKEANQDIQQQAILARNQEREEKAREYYQKGVDLANEGKFDEARDYFEKAIHITEHTEKVNNIKGSQHRNKKQEDALKVQAKVSHDQVKMVDNISTGAVEDVYKKAVDLYRQKKYYPAKEAFEQINKTSPDYRATNSYLKIIDQDIIMSNALPVGQVVIKVEDHRKKDELVSLPKEKEEFPGQIEEKERQKQISKQAEEIYNQAIGLYKNKNFDESRKKFEELNMVVPDYKGTKKYLSRIDRVVKEDQQRMVRQQERVVKQQQKALQEQRRQEERDRKKQGDLRKRELQAQEQSLYLAAVSLFDQKNMDEALKKFNELENLSPDFKSTKKYIARIEEFKKASHLQEQHQKVSIEENPAQEHQEKTGQIENIYAHALSLYRDRQYETARDEFLKVNSTNPQYKSTQYYLAKIVDKIRGSQAEIQHQKELAQERQRVQDLKEKTDQTQEIYNKAMSLYRNHQWSEAKVQFEFVDRMIPNFKRTRQYLSKIEILMVKPAAPLPVLNTVAPVVVGVPVPSVSASTPVKPAVSLEDQQKQAQEISSLADKSAQLYRQIAEIADDRSTVQTKRKIAMVDEVLSDLKRNQDRLVRQMSEKELKRQLEARRVQSEKMYQEGVRYFRSHDYTNAKTRFIALEDIAPDFRATRRYLRRVEEEQKREGVKAIVANDQKEADYLKQLQDKQNVEVANHIQQQEEARERLEQEHQEALKELAQKASDINDEIIRLSRIQDFEAMKMKFSELEDTVSALTVLKDTIAKEKASRGVQEKKTPKPIVTVVLEKPKENKAPRSSADVYKRHEVRQEQNKLLSDGINAYEHKKYTEAKLLLGESAAQHDRRAEVWLKKVDRAITRELLKSQEGEVRQRTAFIAEQVKAQRELVSIQERERQHQKKLTEELERQKRLYEDSRLQDLRKEETLKAQERERRRQEEIRLKSEKENEKQQEMFRFHKIKADANYQPSPVPVPKAVLPSPVSLTAKQSQDQVNEKHREEVLDQQSQEREEKIKQKEIVRQENRRRQEFERQERQHQAQLEAQRESVRKQLEEGVEAMYQEALSLYKQGAYLAAADKFKDVQDILPGYKRSGQYMDEARSRSLNVSAAPVAVPSSPSVSRADNVSRALDLFDSNVK